MTDSGHEAQPHDPDDGPPGDVVARLAALEQENRRLREQLQSTGTARSPAAPSPAPPPSRHRLRSIAAVLLIVLGALLAPVAVVAAWAERELTDTDRYVATVAPLASDPVMKSALSSRLTETVMSQIDVGALLDDVVSGLREQDIAPRATTALAGLEAPLTSGVESFVRNAADRVVDSDQFEQAWEQANRIAHEELVAVMQGTDGDVLQVGQDGQLTVQLAGMVDLLKDRLVERGLGVAANIPEVNATFTIMQTSQLVEIQNRYSQLVALGTWLPWLAIGLLAAGVLTATHRLRALTVAGLALAASMVLLGIALTVARGLYLDALSGKIPRLDAAEVLFDQIVSFLRSTLRTVGVLGLIIALAAYLGGGSASARSLRAGMSRGIARVRDRAGDRGVSTGPFGIWVGQHRGFIRTAIVALAALVVLLAADPTPGLVIGTALVAGALIAILELLARPAPVVPPPEIPA